jgi:large repetitive protein
LSFVSAAATLGSYDDATGEWSVGTLAPGASAILTITATVTAAGAFTNIAQVSAADQFDPDSTPANNVPTEDDQDTVTITARVPTADLQVTKIARPRQAVVGQLVTFTIVVSNVGPDAATNVVLTDQLPAGLRFVSAQASQGNYDSTTGAWTIGTLDSAASATLRITVRVRAAGTIRNTVQVTSDLFDPNLANNTASALINGASIILSKRLLLLSTFR